MYTIDVTRIDLEQLAKEIKTMNRTHALYRVLRDELKKLGFWRYHQRGDPSKGYKVMKERRRE